MLTALLIMVREGFEAALVVAIVYAYLRRIGRLDLARPMWLGVAAASAIAVGVGVVVHLTVESLDGMARMRAFAAISVFAVCVLTWMIFWMRKQARAIKGELQHDVDLALEAGGNIRWAITLVAFFAVLREGLEAALFLIAAATEAGGAEVLVGGAVGLALAATLGYLVTLGGRRMPMAAFFKWTGLILIVFAAGLLSRAVGYLQLNGQGDLPSAWISVFDLRGVAFLNPAGSEVGRFLAAMVGWDPRPSIEQLVAWLGYFGVVTTLFFRSPKAGQPEAPGPVPKLALHPEPRGENAVGETRR